MCNTWLGYAVAGNSRRVAEKRDDRQEQCGCARSRIAANK